MSPRLTFGSLTFETSCIYIAAILETKGSAIALSKK